MLPAKRKGLFQLLIPRELVLLRNESCKLRQIFTVQTSYRLLDFSQTHQLKLSSRGSLRKRYAREMRLVSRFVQRGKRVFV